MTSPMKSANTGPTRPLPVATTATIVAATLTPVTVAIDGRLSPSDETYPVFQRAYELFNAELFDGSLPPVLLTLQRKARTCGYLSPNRFANAAGAMTHELALNPEWFAISPLLEVCQTLVHEQTHLWQHLFGHHGRARFHNREWADKMESIGLMPSSTGRPGGRRTGDCMADYPIVGGRFLQVMQLLLDRGFAITWFDRFLPANAGALATAAQATCDADAIHLNLPAAAISLPTSVGSLAMVEPTPRRTNNSNRMKYSCRGGCGLNVWGKPGIRVRCGDCDTDLAENE